MEQKFEDKIKTLEEIVDKLENGEVGLDESIEEYTKAMNLVKECDDKLKSIEEQVNKMIVDGKEEDFEIPENQKVIYSSFFIKAKNKYKIISLIFEKED